MRYRIKVLAIAALLCAWAYTEIKEYEQRHDFMSQVDSFMKPGDRFTAEDGERLRKLVEGHVQENHEQIEALTAKINELEKD